MPENVNARFTGLVPPATVLAELNSKAYQDNRSGLFDIFKAAEMVTGEEVVLIPETGPQAVLITEKYVVRAMVPQVQSVFELFPRRLLIGFRVSPGPWVPGEMDKPHSVELLFTDGRKIVTTIRGDFLGERVVDLLLKLRPQG